MNRKLSKILSFFLFGFIFVLQSCQKEDYQEFNQSTPKIYHKKFSDIIKENTFRTTFEKVNKAQRKLTSASKTTAMEQQNGFKIASEEANVIVNDSMTSYTLSIVRDNTPDNEFENLIIIVPKNNSTKITAFIYKYTSTTSFKEVSFDPKTFSGTKTLTPIDFDLTIVNSLNQNPDDLLICHPVESWYCYGAGHHSSSDGCTMGFSITEYNCVNIATGGPLDPSGSANTGTNTGGGYGNGSYSNTTSGPKVVTATVPPCKTCNLISDPCSQLKKISNNSNIRSAINNLKTKTGETKEYGYYLTQNSNFAGGVNPPSVANSSPATPNVINMPTGGNNLGAFHTHPASGEDWVPMFSDGDLNYLYWVARDHNNNGNPKDFSEYILTLTVPESTFAIKINDWNKFIAFRGDSKWKNSPNGRKGEYPPLTKKYDKITASGNMEDLEKALLQTLKDFDAGVSLYEASNDLQSWSELTLDPNIATNPPVKKPCN